MSLAQVCKRQALFLISCLHTGLTKKAPQTTSCSNEECNGLLQWTADGSDFLHLSQTTTDVNRVHEACLMSQWGAPWCSLWSCRATPHLYGWNLRVDIFETNGPINSLPWSMHGSLYLQCLSSVLVLFPFLTRKLFLFRPRGTFVDVFINVTRYTHHWKALVFLSSFLPLILNFEQFLSEKCPIENLAFFGPKKQKSALWSWFARNRWNLLKQKRFRSGRHSHFLMGNASNSISISFTAF